MAPSSRRNLARPGTGLSALVLAVLLLAACGPAKPSAPATAPAPTVAPTPATMVPTAAPPSSQAPTPLAVPDAPPATGASNEPPAPRIGRRAPDFELRGLDGQIVRLAEFRGKTVLLNFWATWCPPCKEEMPLLDALYREQRELGLVVLAVDVGEDAATVRPYVAAGEFQFPVALDEDFQVSLQYQTLGLPASYFIDREGVIRDRVSGALTRAQMEAKVELTRASAGKPAPTPVSLYAIAGPTNDVVVAEVGARRITLGEVHRRLDLQLALERLRIGLLLDPLRPEDRAELDRRRAQVLEALVDEELLTRAALAAGIASPELGAIEEEVARLAKTAGGEAALDRELAQQGVTLEYFREATRRGLQVDRFVNRELLTADAQGSPGQIVRRWLEQERARVQPTLRLPTPATGY